jgi:hypothetical protein
VVTPASSLTFAAASILSHQSIGFDLTVNPDPFLFERRATRPPLHATERDHLPRPLKVVALRHLIRSTNS